MKKNINQKGNSIKSNKNDNTGEFNGYFEEIKNCISLTDAEEQAMFMSDSELQEYFSLCNPTKINADD